MNLERCTCGCGCRALDVSDLCAACRNGFHLEPEGLEDFGMEEPCDHEMKELENGMAQCIYCGVIED